MQKNLNRPAPRMPNQFLANQFLANQAKPNQADQTLRSRTLHKRRAALGGFSLIEMMIALAISAVTIAIASRVAVSIGKTVVNTTRSVEVDTEVKMLTEYLGSQMQGVGGATLRPWGSVIVTNGAAGAPDELTITELDDDIVLECGIAAHPGNQLAGAIELTSVAATGSGAPICCFDGIALDGREVIITDADGNYWEQAVVTGANAGNCRINLAPSPQNPANNFFNPSGGGFTNFDNGSVLLVNTRRFWLDGDELKVDEGLSDGTTAEVILADNITDFQAALGYDVDPRDGKVDSDGTTGDEWLYNASGDALAVGGLATGIIQDLRRIAVGVVVNRSINDGATTSTAQILDGNLHNNTDHFYRGGVTYLTFRNSFIFK